MNSRDLMAIAAIGLLLSGCASIVRGSSQSILITTPPTTGADCILTSRRGSWSVISPGAVRVSKSKEDVTVTCTKDGFEEGVASIPSEFEGWTVGNIVFGGLIGLGVDAATGAINNYPNAFQVRMTPVPGLPVAAVAPRPTSSAPAAVRQVAAIPPSLGIVGSTVTRNSSGPGVNLADPYGVFVSGVAPRSPAAEAGIKQGDIIRSFNGRRVSTFEDLDGFAIEVQPGGSVILGVYRNRQIVDVELGL